MSIETCLACVAVLPVKPQQKVRLSYRSKTCAGTARTLQLERGSEPQGSGSKTGEHDSASDSRPAAEPALRRAAMGHYRLKAAQSRGLRKSFRRPTPRMMRCPERPPGSLRTFPAYTILRSPPWRSCSQGPIIRFRSSVGKSPTSRRGSSRHVRRLQTR